MDERFFLICVHLLKEISSLLSNRRKCSLLLRGSFIPWNVAGNVEEFKVESDSERFMVNSIVRDLRNILMLKCTFFSGEINVWEWFEATNLEAISRQIRD